MDPWTSLFLGQDLKTIFSTSYFETTVRIMLLRVWPASPRSALHISVSGAQDAGAVRMMMVDYRKSSGDKMLGVVFLWFMI